MKDKIVISAPFIEQKDGRTVLKADYTECGLKKCMFFSVEDKYAEFLTAEVSDCFVVALLFHAMNSSLDIVSIAPISRQLLENLRSRFIPELDENIEEYHRIDIIADPCDVKFDNEGAVGTGWSGGVDCTYTFLKSSMSEQSDERVTHLVNINAGVFEGSEANIRHEFELNSDNVRTAASEFGLEAIDIDTNIHLVLDETYRKVSSMRLCATVLSLQKLFSKYYVSSTYANVSFNYESASDFEPEICFCVSTQNVTFVNYGCEVTRLNKISMIADSPIAQRHLHVCVKSSKGNCLRCGKCVRTITALYAIGKLDLFSEVFDLNRINNELDEILGDAYFHRKDDRYKESLELMNQKGMVVNDKARQYAHFLEVATRAAQKHSEKILEKKP